MEDIFKNKRFYPQNFFMTANEDTDIEQRIKSTVYFQKIQASP